MSLREVKQILNIFLKDTDMKKLTLEFDKPLLLTQNGFDELTKNAQLVGGEGKTWITMDEFVYNDTEKTLVKLLIHYSSDYDTISVYEIELYRIRKSGE